LAAISATILGFLAIMGQLVDVDLMDSRWGNTLYLIVVLLVTTLSYIKIALRLGVSEVSEAVGIVLKGRRASEGV